MTFDLLALLRTLDDPLFSIVAFDPDPAGVVELHDGSTCIQRLRVQGTGLWALQEGLGPFDYLSIGHNPIDTLPRDIRFERDARFWLPNCRVKVLPAGLTLSLLDASWNPIDELPERLALLKGDSFLQPGRLVLAHTRVRRLPPDLVVEGQLDLTGCLLSRAAAEAIMYHPGLSVEAKRTGLASAGYTRYAEAVPAVTDSPGPAPSAVRVSPGIVDRWRNILRGADQW